MLPCTLHSPTLKDAGRALPLPHTGRRRGGTSQSTLLRVPPRENGIGATESLPNEAGGQVVAKISGQLDVVDRPAAP